MRCAWWVAALTAAAVACGGSDSEAVFCDRVEEARAGEVTALTEEALDRLRAVRDAAPGAVTADLDVLVRWSEQLLAGDLPSAAETREADEAGRRVRRTVRDWCRLTAGERGGTR